MSLRTLHVLTVFFAFLFTAGSKVGHSSDQESRPNILFIICDDLNCDLACYGHPLVQSPNLDSLASRGVRFQNAYCQYPLCGPSRASFMSGWYPDQTMIHQNAIFLRERAPDSVTVTQHFREAGYYASRIGKIFHYHVPLHIGTGGHDDPFSWNQTVNPRGRDVIDQDQVITLKEGQYGGTLSWLAAEGTDEEQTDGIAVTEAIRQLEAFSKDETNFFLAVGLYRPHTPYVAPKAYFDSYPIDRIQIPEVPDGYLETLPKAAAATLTRKKDQVNLDPHLARQAIQAYYASITFADAQVGRLLRSLDDLGLSKNTVVLFTSDHGYHMGQHGHYQKTTLFEDATHVPLIMAGPGIKEGAVATTMAEMVDFYPTLAELAGLPKQPAASGVSLVPALRDPQKVVRESAFSQYGTGYSLRTADFRYTRWGSDEEAELYDRRDDPAEMINLAGNTDYREKQAELDKRLQRRIDEAKTAPRGRREATLQVRRMVKDKRKK